MAFINIPTKDNTTPLSPDEFNYLVSKLNGRKLSDLIDVQASDAIDKNIIRHNGSGWVYYTIENDFYTKNDINTLFNINTGGGAPSFEAQWGNISGTIRLQTDLIDNFGDLKSASNVWEGSHYAKNYVLEGATSSNAAPNGIYALLSQVLTDVPANAVFTDTVYTHPGSHSIGFITGLQSALDNKVETSLLGSPNGVAELNANGFVKNEQLPAYVDDVIEGTFVNQTTFNDLQGSPVTGETGKIYVDTTLNKTYRWSGTVFSVISETISLGETSSTAYRGDRGAIAYNHSQTDHNYLRLTGGTVSGSTSFTLPLITRGLQNSFSYGLFARTGNIPLYVQRGDSAGTIARFSYGNEAASLGNHALAVNTDGIVVERGGIFGEDVEADNFILTGATASSSVVSAAWSALTGNPTDNSAFNAWVTAFEATVSLPNNVAYKDSNNNFSTSQGITGDLVVSNIGTFGGAVRSSKITTGNTQMINASSSNVYVGNPLTALSLEGNSSILNYYDGTSNQQIFHNGYHPNADKWTTARTITLGGDLQGSVSIDGSSNVTLSAEVSNNSHEHDDRYYTETESDSRFLRGDVADQFLGNLTTGADNHITFGPNTTWNSNLRVGGNGYSGNGNTASVVTTNGNLHLDSSSASTATYINYYAGTGGIKFGGGAANIVANMNSSGQFYFGSSTSSPYWHASNDGAGSGLDADRLHNILPSTTAQASTIPVRDASGDIYVRLIRSNFQTDPTIDSGATVTMRVNNASDNFLRNITRAGFLTWLGTVNDADLWGGNQFSSFINQPLRTTDSPTFANVNSPGKVTLTGTGLGSGISFNSAIVANDSFGIRVNGTSNAGEMEFWGTDDDNEPFVWRHYTSGQDGSGASVEWMRLGAGGALSVSTINTGQGVTEVHLMNQNVRTTDSPTFVDLFASKGYFSDNVEADNFILTGATASSSVVSAAWSALTGDPTDNTAFNAWATAFEATVSLPSNLAYKDSNNNFSASQGITGDLTVSGKGTFSGEVTIDTGPSNNGLTIKGTNPTINLLDDDSSAHDFYLHVNSNRFYILSDRQGGNQVGTGWEAPHPLLLDSATNIGYVFDSRIFNEAYHPNADKWTTARTVTLSGDLTGSVSIDGSSNVTLSASVNDSDLWDGNQFSDYLDQGVKTTDSPTFSTINTGQGNNELYAMNQNVRTTDPVSFESVKLYNDATDTANNRVAVYDSGGTTSYGMMLWNSNGVTGDWATMIYGPNQANRRISFGKITGSQFSTHSDVSEIAYFDLDDNTLRLTADAYVLSNKVFHDGYHPNADKWTTARTITLSGDLQGSVSIDGSSNVTLSASVNDNSHAHSDYVTKTGLSSELFEASTGVDWNAIGYLNGIYRLTGSGSNPFGGSHATLLNIGQGSGDIYGFQLASNNTTKLKYRGFGTAQNTVWYDIWHSGNDGAGSGLDADLWDGNQFSSYLNQGVRTGDSPTFVNLTATNGYFNNNVDADLFRSNNFVSGVSGFQIEQGTSEVSVLRFDGDRFDFYAGSNASRPLKVYETGLVQIASLLVNGAGTFDDKVEADNFILTGATTSGSVTSAAWSALTGDPTDNTAFNAWATAFEATVTLPNNVAYKDSNNNFSTSQGITGDLTVSGKGTFGGMVQFSTSMSSADDYINSPITIRERGLVGSAQADGKYSPNLNFHWSGRTSFSLWMDSTGRLNYGAYSGAGVPDATGTFRAAFLQGDGSGVTNVNAQTLDGIDSSSFLQSESNSFLAASGTGGSHPGTGRIAYAYSLAQGTAPLGMPTVNNANAIININKHSGEYNSQLGFSSNGSMYYRNFNNVVIDGTTPWRKVYDSGNLTLATLGGVEDRVRTNWNDSTVIDNVVGQLAWKNYGNNHTIFDASAGTNPIGGAEDNTNPDIAWQSTYPTLMGFNGTQTFGVRVDSSRYADLWKTPRTLTVTLSGDVTGTASQSVNGSGNSTWSINAIVGDNSHSHSNYLLNTTDSLTGDLSVTGKGTFDSLDVSNFLVSTWSGTSDRGIYNAMGAVGSTGGIILEGTENGNIILGLKDNDPNDSFTIIGKNLLNLSNPGIDYSTKLFEVNALGDGFFGGVLFLVNDLVIGNNATAPTFTPANINLGGTYSPDAGENFKVLLYDSAGAQAGFGISTGQLDYGVWDSTADHTFYAGTNEIARLSGTGNLSVLGRGTFAGVTSNGLTYVNDRLLLNKPASTYQFMGLNTASGSDNGRLFIGATSDANASRGATIGLNGNQYADAGDLNLFGGSNGGSVSVYTGLGSPLRMVVHPSGRVSIGNSNDSFNLDITGDVRATSTMTATNFILSSDFRMKQDIESYVPNRIDVKWRSYSFLDSPDVKRVGVIAQELESSHPEFVNTDKEGMKSVSYIDLLVAKNAELQDRLEILEALVSELLSK